MTENRPKLYQYVGPTEILERNKDATSGTVIIDRSELVSWVKRNSDISNLHAAVTATFVIDTEGRLILAPRRSEHIACSGGEPVLSAGEITISSSGEVLQISNYSTGFCPEPCSWSVCSRTLDRMSVPNPGNFTQVIVFRKCPNCLQRNIVKDEWYYCDVCGADLPLAWNFEG